METAFSGQALELLESPSSLSPSFAPDQQFQSSSQLPQPSALPALPPHNATPRAGLLIPPLSSAPPPGHANAPQFTHEHRVQQQNPVHSSPLQLPPPAYYPPYFIPPHPQAPQSPFHYNPYPPPPPPHIIPPLTSHASSHWSPTSHQPAPDSYAPSSSGFPYPMYPRREFGHHPLPQFSTGTHFSLAPLSSSASSSSSSWPGEAPSSSPLPATSQFPPVWSNFPEEPRQDFPGSSVAESLNQYGPSTGRGHRPLRHSVSVRSLRRRASITDPLLADPQSRRVSSLTRRDRARRGYPISRASTDFRVPPLPSRTTEQRSFDSSTEPATEPLILSHGAPLPAATRGPEQDTSIMSSLGPAAPIAPIASAVPAATAVPAVPAVPDAAAGDTEREVSESMSTEKAVVTSSAGSTNNGNGSHFTCLREETSNQEDDEHNSDKEGRRKLKFSDLLE